MADNVELNPGAGGDIAAADDIGGVKFQRVKLTLGGDGVDDGDVADGNPMPTADASLAALIESVRQTNDTMLAILSSMRAQMPRLDAQGRQVVRVMSSGENDLYNPYGGIFVNSVGDANNGRQISRMYEPQNFADAGCARLYQNIIVS